MHRLKLFAIIAILVTGCNQNRENHPVVCIKTELGDIEAEIFLNKAPITAKNFMSYVHSGKYNRHAYFYRVVRLNNQPAQSEKIEIIQGGFYHDSLVELYGFPPIAHETTKETGIKHEDGVLSMARYEPGTASSEFFICIGKQPSLDYGGKRNPDLKGFSAFGKVISGMDIVLRIQQQQDSSQILLNPIRILEISKKQ